MMRSWNTPAHRLGRKMPHAHVTITRSRSQKFDILGMSSDGIDTICMAAQRRKERLGQQLVFLHCIQSSYIFSISIKRVDGRIWISIDWINACRCFSRVSLPRTGEHLDLHHFAHKQFEVIFFSIIKKCVEKKKKKCRRMFSFQNSIPKHDIFFWRFG